MKLIRKNYNLTFNQVGLLKLGVLSVGVAAGSYWSADLLPYLWWFLGLAVVICIYLFSSLTN